MAKRAAGKTGTTRKKPAAKKIAGSRLVTTAEVIGTALGRAAKGANRIKKAVTTRGATRGTKRTRKDPAKEAERLKTRAQWKSRARASTAVELAQEGALVDERARARSTTGRSWSNRKPR